MKKLEVLYFGNPHIQGDALALNIIPSLSSLIPEIKFTYIKDTFQLVDLDFTDKIILDVVESLKKVTLLTREDLTSLTPFTGHDFDLGFFLKLAEKDAIIIGIPMTYSKEEALKEVEKILRSLLSN